MFVTVRVEVISGKLETEILLNVSTIDVTAEGTIPNIYYAFHILLLCAI